MKIKLKVEFELEGYENLYDFENERPELFGFLIAELEEDDQYFLISVDGRIFVSNSVSEIVWFLEANLKKVDELISLYGKAPDFKTVEMNVYVEECESLELAFQLAYTLKMMEESTLG